MPKSTITFVCTECGGESIRWAGQCPHCRAWNTLQEFQVREAARDSRSRPHEAARPLPLSEIGSEDAPRMPLGWGELNRVLGGGIVPGSIVLIGGVPVFLVGHVTKEGSIAGPRVLEHIVDTVLYLEGDRRQELRILRATKSRFGSAEEIGVFAMGEAGLEEVPDPSAAILAGAASAAPGTVIVAAVEGTRPLLVEVQSLVNKTQNSMVRRVANGIDLNRLHMILAVIEKRLQASFGSSDIFVSVAGGIRITEPAADLGLALSIVSNESSRPMPDGLIVIGELGLAGEVRRVSQLERRLQEAARHGLTRALIPAGARAGRHSGLDVVEVRSLAEAVSAVFSSPIKSGAYIQGAGLTVS